MELKPISEHTKKRLGEKIRLYLNAPWYFVTWLDKFILISLSSLGVLRILQWIF